MKTKLPNLLASLLRDFFGNHLPVVRGMSPHTIESYRDCIVLLLRYIASLKAKPAVSLELEDLRAREVQSFLSHLEQERNNSPSTRNARLSAIHSFFRFVASLHPDRIEHAQTILAIPFKKNQSTAPDYLEYDEIRKILSVVDRSTAKGRRDYVLLATMFNTGARVQEILDLRVCDLQLSKPFQIRLSGKGGKQRCCPVWPQTAHLLRRLCMELGDEAGSETRIFKNCRGAPLTRFGVRYILDKCLQKARISNPGLSLKRLHPHSIRHSTAVALLKSGVDLATIGQWLGHSDLNTTNRYAAIDLEAKRKAIEKIRPVDAREDEAKPWRDEETIIRWLESL